MKPLRWLLALTLCACSPLQAAFQCRTHEQCVDAVAGTCEPSGFCSFPDGDCASGRRYGQLAGDDLGGRCVDGGGVDGGFDGGGDGGDGGVTYNGCAQSLAGGGAHACAVISGGVVECWGRGASGQLGSGALADQPLPSAVLDSRAVPLVASSLALGAAHSCAVSAMGTITCWGDNSRGQLGTGAAPSPQPVPALLGLNPVGFAAAGVAHTCASVGAANLVWCWGANDSGQLGYAGADAPMPQPALARDGTQLAGVSALAGGRAHSCALLGDHVSCWGRNVEGQLGGGNTAPSTVPVDVAGLGAVTAIAAGGDRACALVGGAAWCWGAGQPVAMQVATATAVAVGAVHACALGSGGSVVCWGDNPHGQLGDGNNARSDQPVAVVDLDGRPLGAAVEVAVGDGYSCARTLGGAVLCWGDAAMLGDGSGSDRPRAGMVRLTCP
jgi:alpha-tubulin suppressor-like RCC1 family protein